MVDRILLALQAPADGTKRLGSQVERPLLALPDIRRMTPVVTHLAHLGSGKIRGESISLASCSTQWLAVSNYLVVPSLEIRQMGFLGSESP
jgi:hypothetical protein